MTQESPINEDEARYRQQYLNEIAIEPNRTGRFVISFPKSGRTWHRAMLGTYLTAFAKLDNVDIFALDAINVRMGLARIHYTHNGANFIDYLSPDDPLVASAELWRDKPVLLLIRNPRDILVSAWHHLRFRMQATAVDLQTFVQDPRTGIDKILAAYRRWSESRHLAASFDVISYERMTADPGRILQQTVAFAGGEIAPQLIDRAVEMCRFDRMQANEDAGAYAAPFIRPTEGGALARKVRIGQIGAHVAHLSPDDLAFIGERVAQLGDPFEEYYIPLRANEMSRPLHDQAGVA